MDFLTHLTRKKFQKSSRWIVKYNSKGLVREVKLVYKPSEYSKSNAKRRGIEVRTLYNQEQLIKILKNDKEKRSKKTNPTTIEQNTNFPDGRVDV